MKSLISTFILLFFAASSTFGQGGQATVLRHGSILPAACSDNQDFFIKDKVGPFWCHPANTWVPVTTGSSAGVSSLTGTANQVIVSAPTGAVTLSTPQNIHTGAAFQVAREGLGVPADASNLLQTGAGSFINSSGALADALVGPHSLGGSPNSVVQFLITGTWAGNNTAYGLDLNTTLTPTAGNNAFGFELAPNLTKASSGTHPLYAALDISPSFTAGASAITDIALINLPTFAAPASTTNATNIKAIAPTAATNNFIANFLKSDGSTVVAKFYSSGRIDVPNITTSGMAQTDAICSDGTQLILDTVSCIASSERVKNWLGFMTCHEAKQIIQKMKPGWFQYKNIGRTPEHSDWTTHAGFKAEDVEKIDRRLASYDYDGNLHGVQYEAYTAVLTKYLQCK